MLRVGLTGGIGAGKSTVAARLAEHGAVVIDADRIAREVVEPGTDGLTELVSVFGEHILTAEGALDRSALAATAFADDAARERLNAVLHPRIAARTAELMSRAADDAIVVHDVALLVENGLAPNYHLVLVVDADEQVRVQRLAETRGMNAEDARARIAAQATTAQRRAVADVWIDNGGDRDAVLRRVDAVWADRLVPFEAAVRQRRPRPAQPPVLVTPDPEWPEQAERALARVRAVAGERAVRTDHIGSTAVPGLPAKDVLDLQLVVPELADADALAEPLSDAGFVRVPGEWYDHSTDGESSWEKRVHVGADPGRPVNLHVRPADGPAWRLAVLFRDWLRAVPEEVVAYTQLKRRLADDHRDDADVRAYADRKQPWITAAFTRAEEWAARSGWSVTTR
ncbi:dephospho-CoA kinase [Saccharomonospora saliphila]|uniref:dephospho-CoA kinase n=1 Tax=Saccharomonospora saliphila TaxID=369829 RepID=UPI00039C2205|nr:dephospho-CoA kinase [Saccharomonospora saliphila]